MAFPRKGSHKIVVDGTEYRWRLGKRESQGQFLGFADRVLVQRANGGSVLIRTLGWLRWDSYDSKQEPITPRIIEEFIREGIREGWNPEQPGPPVRVGKPFG
jgi:hypothetical protein